MRQDVAGILGGGRINGHVAFVNVLDIAVLVDHERGAIAVATLFVKNSVILNDCAFEVA